MSFAAIIPHGFGNSLSHCLILLKNPAVELAKPKYQGTKFWPAKIMLVGDIVADYGIWYNESR